MLKKTFDFTPHALKRMEQRNIPDPNGFGTKIANGKTKKLIRESCLKSGFNNEYVYWTKLTHEYRYVYVCVQKDVSQYTVVTCFKYIIRSIAKEHY